MASSQHGVLAMKSLFAIISQPRAGTHLIRGLLNSHPDLMCDGELFHPAIQWDKLDQFENGAPAERVIHQLWAEQGQNSRHYGFQTHDPGYPRHVRFNWDPVQIAEFEPKPKLIWIHRRNVMAQFASWMIASQKNEWVKFEGSGRDNQRHRGQIILEPDPEYAAFWIRKLINARAMLREKLCDCESVTLAYEDICDDPDKACGRIFDLIGVPTLPVKSQTIAQRNYQTPQVFSNYEDIAESVLEIVGRDRMQQWQKTGT